MNAKSMFSVLPLILIVVLLAGCTTVKEISTKKAFLVNNAVPVGGPTVTLQSVQESPPADPTKVAAYQADPTYLGKGMRQIIGYGPVPILPYNVEYDEFHADDSRVAVVRAAVLSRLKALGIPAINQTGGGVDQSMQLPEDHLSVSLRLREFNVDTEFSLVLPFIIVCGFAYNDQVAHIVIDCQLWQSGQSRPLWEGTVESRCSTKDFKKDRKFTHENIIGEVVYSALDQFIIKSGIVETRARLGSQRYDELMKTGREQAVAGQNSNAMATYGQATISAMTPERKRVAEEAGFAEFTTLAKTWLATTPRPAMPDDVLTYKALAKNAVERKDFPAALAAYYKALEKYTMWPAGHYNAATLAAESGDYAMAAYHMRRYLVLAPDAKDASDSKDKFLLWQHKAKD